MPLVNLGGENNIPVAVAVEIPANSNLVVRSHAGNLYALYTNDVGGTHTSIYVAKYNYGTKTWEDIGCDSATSTPIVQYPNAEVGLIYLFTDLVNGTPYAYNDYGGNLDLFMWNGSSWINVAASETVPGFVHKAFCA